MFLASTAEKHLETRQLAIPIAEPRIYNFTQIPSGTRINATLSGAFLPYETNIELYHKRDFLTRKSMKVDDKDKENYIRVYLQTNTEKILTSPKIYGVTPPNEFDLTKPSRIPIMFDIGEDNMDLLEENYTVLQLVIQSNFTKTPEAEKREMPLMFTYDISPINRQIGVIFAAFILIFLYVLIIWEVKHFFRCYISYKLYLIFFSKQIVHRTFAAMIASTLSIALLAALNDRPTHHEIVSWIDVETILLLFSMMILVAILTETGVFNHLAVYAYRVNNFWL